MTLFTSDTDNRTIASKNALIYLLISIFVALFGAVYEKFSHGVYSYSMLYAFAYPLIGGVLPYICIAVSKSQSFPNAVPRLICHFAVATLTVGSVVHGVIEIYGTMNYLTYIYPAVGGVLYLVGVILYIVSNAKK